MKMALYKSIKYDFLSVFEVSDYIENDPDSVRQSEIMEVEFVQLPQLELSQKEIAVIDEQIRKTMVECEETLNTLKHRKAELLALPDFS